jgi:anti-sigma factor RsiW
MSMNRHEPFEELISASLHGDLTADEQARLDAHLDTCAQCRETLASFSEQRRIMAGLRHVAPPRDLGARVRTGIERGEGADLPWWRRPIALAGIGGGLAVVAGALLAIVLLNNEPTTPPVGQATPSASAEASALPPSPSAAPPSTAPTEAPSVEATPAETPIPSPEPDVFLAMTGSVEEPTLEVRDSAGQTVVEADPPSGEPIAAELSPDGQWLAYISVLGESGMNEVRVTRLAGDGDSPVSVGRTVPLGESVAGSPFLEHLFWTSDGRYLAFTLQDPDDGSTDVWLFLPQTGESKRLTDVGNAYAGSWTPDGAGTHLLWVSLAGEAPSSYLVSIHDDAGPITPIDPSESPFPNAEGVFQPILSPNGALVIFWSGQMHEAGDQWLFQRGGLPWLAEVAADGQGGYAFDSSRELFRDLTPVGGEAFESAAIEWGGDSDAYAVWGAAWTGPPQGAGYPDAGRIYFGHATDAGGLTSRQAIDAGDIPEDQFVVDVKVSPTGHHLVVTAGHPRAGVMDPPRADLLLITRNTGDVPDEVENLVPDGEGWFGPAAFDEAP